MMTSPEPEPDGAGLDGVGLDDAGVDLGEGVG